MLACLPLVLLLICPLMMLFMMRGHGHSSHGARDGGVFNEHGELRRGESLTLLSRERDRLKEQLAELDSEIETRSALAGGAQATRGARTTG